MKKLILALMLSGSLCAAESSQEVQEIKASRFADVSNITMLTALGFVKPIVISGELLFVIGGGIASLSDLSSGKLGDFSKSFSLLCIGLGLSHIDHRSVIAENECLNALSTDVRGVGNGCNILAKCVSVGFILYLLSDKYLKV